ncbi:toprim domain-containing protein [Loktanella sp. M215]|uniref:toprim domain-containing protein n=1 Tax=Loktanella sp. M215 TaxID=2675431 RepID=UPI001F2B12AE|nr:toprim domain-containing protein [Loktanella sp. M215]
MTMENSKAELEMFKSHDANTLMGALGWTDGHATKEGAIKIEKKGSNSTPYTKDGRNVLVFKGRTGAYMISEIYPVRRTVTIIDIANEVTGSLGKTRVELRSLIGTAKEESSRISPSHQTNAPQAPAPVSASSDTVEKKSSDEVRAEYVSGSEAWTPAARMPDYLLDRSISFIPLVYAASFRTSRGGTNIRFPYLHFVDDVSVPAEYAGVETKADGFKSFTKGGRPGAWIAGHTDLANKIVICESPIDCFSWIMQRPFEDLPFLVAVRSGGEQSAINLIKRAAGQHEKVTVFISTDNDHAGMAYASKIMLGVSKEPTVCAKYVAPDKLHNDQNNYLVAALVADDENGGTMRNDMRKLRRMIFDDYIKSRNESASPTLEAERRASST